VLVPRRVFRGEINESGYNGRAAARGFSPAAAARQSKFWISVGDYQLRIHRRNLSEYKGVRHVAKRMRCSLSDVDYDSDASVSVSQTESEGDNDTESESESEDSSESDE